MLQVIVHINYSDSNRQLHGLKNVSNILAEVGESSQIEVVCHGLGIGLVVKKESEHAAKVEQLCTQGVTFAACENTLKSNALTKGDLLPGVSTVPSGAVEIIRKQQQGFAYFRP